MLPYIPIQHNPYIEIFWTIIMLLIFNYLLLKQKQIFASIIITLFFTAGLFLSLSSHAELVVLEDLGGESTQPFFESINDGGFAESNAFDNNTKIVSANYASMLPVRSESITPALFNPIPANLPTMQPLFLIGDDKLSRDWLNTRIDYLKQLNAVGYIVNIDNEATLNELLALTQGLQVVPTSADDLSQRLGIKHYPALITSTGIEQ